MLEKQVQPKFTLQLSSSAEAIHQQHSTLISIQVARSEEYTEVIHLIYQSVHEGIIGAFSGNGDGAYLLISVSSDVPPGRYSTSVVGKSSDIEQVFPLTLFILNNPPKSRIDLDIGLTPDIDLNI